METNIVILDLSTYDLLRNCLSDRDKTIEKLNNKIFVVIELLSEKENKKDDTALFNNIAKAIQILKD